MNHSRENKGLVANESSGYKCVIQRCVQIFYRVWLLVTPVYNFPGENAYIF